MKPRPRILHIVSKIDPYGASRQLGLLVNGLQNKGWENQVIALRTIGDSHRAIEAAGVPVVCLQQRWKADPITAGRLASVLRRAPTDLIHCWDLPALAYSHVANAACSKLPLLATMSSLRLDLRLRRFALRRMAHRIAQLVVVNNAIHELCANFGVDQEKLRIIPPAVLQRNTRVSSEARDARGAVSCVATRLELLDKLRLPKDARLIAVVGPLLPHKRVDDAIWCFELVRVLHGNARLLVIGDGPQRRQLERFARLVCEPRLVGETSPVRFLGMRNDLAEILPHVDVLWQRSDSRATTQRTMPTGAPYAVLEAMAAGVPIVATDIGPHQQVIEHGRTGFLSPLGGRADCTRYTDQLLSDPDLARRVGSAGQQHVREHFLLERMIDAYEQVYEQMVED